MNKKYEILRMHICVFKRVRGILTSSLSEYPVRLCIFDKENKKIIDVDSMHEYPYIKVINMKYISSENNKIQDGKRYGCIEYATVLSLDLDSKELDKCKNIIDLLNSGHKFKDGNSELTNDQYLEMINSVQKDNKLVKKLKKRK